MKPELMSNHRRLSLTGAVAGKEPDEVIRYRDCVVLKYGDLRTMTRVASWQVYCPFDPDEAALLMSLGVGDRARRAFEAREGRPGIRRSPIAEATADAFRRRLPWSQCPDGEPPRSS